MKFFCHFLKTENQNLIRIFVVGIGFPSYFFVSCELWALEWRLYYLAAFVSKFSFGWTAAVLSACMAIVGACFCFVWAFHLKCKVQFTAGAILLSLVVLFCVSCRKQAALLPPFMHTHTHTHTHTCTCTPTHVSNETKQQRFLQRTVVTAGQIRPHQGWMATAGRSVSRQVSLSPQYSACVWLNGLLDVVQHSVQRWPWRRLPFAFPCKCKEKNIFTYTNLKVVATRGWYVRRILVGDW